MCPQSTLRNNYEQDYKMVKIAHIVNVTEICETNKASYLHIAQPLTMKSMVMARQQAKGLGRVDLFATKHASENVAIPPEFNWAPDIEKYAWEYINSLKKIKAKKPMLRIVDILTSLYPVSDADFFIYTNIDIGLFPDFYIKVFEFIKNGYDAFCINRTNLPKKIDGVLLDKDNIELIFTLRGKGDAHRGIDCFVFKRQIVPLLDLGNVFIGYPPVGQVLLTQIKNNSKRFKWFKNESITFHIGKDALWVREKEQKTAYWKENYKQARGLYKYCFERAHERFFNRLRKIARKLVKKIRKRRYVKSS